MMGLLGGYAISAGLVKEKSILLDDEHDIGAVSVLNALSSVVGAMPSYEDAAEALHLGDTCKRNVQHTKRCYENGEIYEGPFLNGMRHGEGAASTREEGSKFCGSYKYDEPFHGTLITPAYTYFGHLRGNKFHGVGTLAYSDGTIYYGDFKYGLYHGVGKEITTTSGTSASCEDENRVAAAHTTLIYTGSFEFGRRHGIGTLMNSSEQSCIYSGEWKNGVTVGESPTTEETRSDFHAKSDNKDTQKTSDNKHVEEKSDDDYETEEESSDSDQYDAVDQKDEIYEYSVLVKADVVPYRNDSCFSKEEASHKWTSDPAKYEVACGATDVNDDPEE